MSALREDLIEEMIMIEGGYTDHPSDSGGPTNFGITQSTARRHGYTGPMQYLPVETAKEIYRRDYWDTIRGDELCKLSGQVVNEVFDIGVNTGVRRAGLFLQQALNAFNKKQTLYLDLVADGVIGDKTVSALEAYLEVRDAGILVKALNVLQGAFYLHLAGMREKDEDFVYGWIRQRVNL